MIPPQVYTCSHILLMYIVYYYIMCILFQVLFPLRFNLIGYYIMLRIVSYAI